ncbi:MAG: G/U mismatch-specific DNA glycosylase [Candidatus Eisenbacteria bacterium]|nr:G/U mismatch-specific DNA glycosylase [Candidatus Eisenbacteria bacterium]
MPRRPSRDEVLAAEGARVPDVIAPGLRILFCGINPGLYSGAVGHHFARPGNRFWKALAGSGLTRGEVSPFDERTLLEHGIGITNLVGRATARAEELTPAELRGGLGALTVKARRYGPRYVAMLGIGAYRIAFGRREAELGLRPETVGGVPLWLLPNPSGLNAHYSVGDLSTLFADLRLAAFGPGEGP